MRKVETIFELTELTPSESATVFEFSPVQIAAFKNMFTQLAIRKVNMSVDVNAMQDYVQKEAFVAGQLNVLRSFIEGKMDADLAKEEVEEVETEEEFN